MQSRQKRSQGHVNKQQDSSNASFSADARLSLFQALGLKKDITTPSAAPAHVTLMPYGGGQIPEDCKKNTDRLEVQASSNRRNNNRNPPTTFPETTPYHVQEAPNRNDRFDRNNNNRNNNNKHNARSAPNYATSSQPIELASVPSLKITSSSSNERIVEVVTVPLALSKPTSGPVPVRILTRPPAPPTPSTFVVDSSVPTNPSTAATRSNNLNRRGRGGVPPSIPPEVADFTHPSADSVLLGGKKSHIMAHTHAPPSATHRTATAHKVSDVQDKQDKPVPMLLRILQAAKAKSEQRRAEDNTIGAALPLPASPDLVVPAATPAPFPVSEYVPLAPRTMAPSTASAPRVSDSLESTTTASKKVEGKERSHRGSTSREKKDRTSNSIPTTTSQTTLNTTINEPTLNAIDAPNDSTIDLTPFATTTVAAVEFVNSTTAVAPKQQVKSSRKAARNLTLSIPHPTSAATSSLSFDDSVHKDNSDGIEVVTEASPDDVLDGSAQASDTLPLSLSLPSSRSTHHPQLHQEHEEKVSTPVSMHSDSGDENLLREAAHISDSQLTLEEPFTQPVGLFALNTTSASIASVASVSSASSHSSYRNSDPMNSRRNSRVSITIGTDLYADSGPSPLYSPYTTSLYTGTSLFPSNSYGSSAYTSPFYSPHVTPQGQKPSFFSELNDNYDVLVTKEVEDQVNEGGNAVINEADICPVCDDTAIASRAKLVQSRLPAAEPSQSDSNVESVANKLQAAVNDAAPIPESAVSPTSAAVERVVHSFGSGGFQIGIINSAVHSHINAVAALPVDGDNFAVPSVPVSVDAVSAAVASTSTSVDDTIIVTSSPPSTTTTTIPASVDTATALLPVDAHRETILAHVRQNSVTIINGMTGCGKSTRIPIMLWEDSLTYRNKSNTNVSSDSGSRNSSGIEGISTPVTSGIDSTDTPTTSPAPPSLPSEAYIMVSQPRRIAATALKNRLFTHYHDTIGLRLGHGMREETANTRIWFVTTGYLVRLLTHKMHTFQHYTHLVIDEIHERSLDCDILCYLAKKLVYTYPHIRIVLMSATAHSAMFQSYFHTPHAPIFVGVRRYHLSEYFLENMHSLLPHHTHRTLNRLIECSNAINAESVNNVVHDVLVKDQLYIAHAVARSIARPGGAVLIFVSGMSDITELMEIFSNNNNNNSGKKDTPKTVVLAVHSDIPHETQLLAFAPTPADQIKVVIATNAAESSVTIPDVDHVICCGTSKVLRYSERMHTTMLVNTWISKASATQRAGRTGRVRPGSVYHLYTQQLYSLFDDFEMSEVKRQPMTEVALRLKSMLRGGERGSGANNSGVDADNIDAKKDDPVEDSAAVDDNKDEKTADVDLQDNTDVIAITSAAAPPSSSSSSSSLSSSTSLVLPSVTSVLLSLIEPPSLQSIHAALRTLHSYGMLTSSAEDGSLTEIGTLAADLPVDFMLGRFIGYAVLLGVCREAVIMAAALGNPKSLFRTPNTLIQTDVDEFNSHCRHLFLSLSRLDRGLLSEPFTAIQAFVEYHQCCHNDRDKVQWCKDNCIVPTRMRQLSSVVQHLYSTVYTSLSGTKGSGGRSGKKKSSQHDAQQQSVLQSLQSLPPLTPRTANLLRLCLVWAFPHHLLKQKALLCSEQQMCTIDIPGLALPTQAFDNFVHGVYHSSASNEFTSMYNHNSNNSIRKNLTNTSASSADSTTINTSNIPEIHYTIQAIGKRTYIACPLDRSIDAYIDSFLDFVHTMDAHVAFLTGTFSRPEHVMIVYDRYICEERLKPYIYSIFGGNNIITLSSSAERVIYKALVTSRNQLVKLQEVFSEESWRCVLFDLPGSGDASLVCANCIPSEHSIRILFLGNDLTYRITQGELSEQEYGWYGWEYTSKIKRSKLKVLCYEDSPSMYIGSDGYMTVTNNANNYKLYRMETVRNIPLAIQLVNFTRYNSNSDWMLKISVPAADAGTSSLSYAEDEDEHYNSNNNNNHNNNNAKRTTQDARRGASIRPSHSSSSIQSQGYNSTTTEIVAIKMHTINTEWVRLPYVDNSYTHTSSSSSSSSSTPHSNYSNNNHVSSSDITTTTTPAADTALHYIDDNKRVSFPAYSLQRYAQHLHNDPVYCVCYSLTMVAGSGSSANTDREKTNGSKGTPSDSNSNSSSNSSSTSNNNNSNNNTTYRAEGCSTLPVGSEWLSRALACVSKLNSEVTKNFKDGCRLSKQQLQLAAQIQDYLTQSSLSYCFELHNTFLLNNPDNNNNITTLSDSNKDSEVCDYSPLNSDVDALFADYIHRNSMYPAKSHSEGDEYAIDMDEFVPLGQSHSNSNNSNSNSGSSSDGSTGGKKAALNAEPATSAATSGATNTNAWLQSSSLVRTAGNLKNRQHKHNNSLDNES